MDFKVQGSKKLLLGVECLLKVEVRSEGVEAGEVVRPQGDNRGSSKLSFSPQGLWEAGLTA